MYSNKGFYLEKKNSSHNSVVDFLEYKTDKYRFRCGNYYFKSMADQERFRNQKKYDFKDSYKKLIRDIDLSEQFLKENDKRNRFRNIDGQIVSSKNNLPKDYYLNVLKMQKKKSKEEDLKYQKN